MKDGDWLVGCCLLKTKESNVAELPVSVVLPPLDAKLVLALSLLLLPKADADPVATVLKLGGELSPVA